MEIVKQVRTTLQSIIDVDDLENFEMENNFEYEIVLDNLIRADYLALLLKVTAKHKPIVEYRYFKNSGCSKDDMYLSITFDGGKNE